MEFRILGALEITADGRPLALGGPRQRALLAALLVHANEVVSTDRLIELVWGGEPPETATTALHGYVSSLRRLLEPTRAADEPPGVLLTRAPGYVLRVSGPDLDLHRFESLAREARDALGRDDAEHALALLEEALGLWRGSALEDLPPGPFAETERRRLSELRLAAFEDRVDAELALGRHARLVGELEARVARHPLRERLRAQLMLALYRSGRQAEALATYQEARGALVDDLGIDPGPELQRLERSILNQDPALDAPRRTPPSLPEVPPRRRDAPALRRRVVIGAALASALAAAVVILVVAVGRGSDDDGPAFTARGNTLVEIDPRTNRAVGSIAVGARPDAVVATAGSLWVANLDDGTVSRVDPHAGVVSRTISTGHAATGLAPGPGGLWFVAPGQGTMTRAGLIDPRFNDVTRTIQAQDLALARASPAIALGAGSLWIVPGGVGMLVRVDPSTERAVRIDTHTCCPTAVAFGAGAAWVADAYVDTVTRVDLENLALATIPIGRGPGSIAADDRGVWVAIEHEDAVAYIDPATNAVTARVRVGRSPTGIAAGAGGVWVANSRDGTVTRIDARSRRPTATIAVGERPSAVVVSGGKVWVTVQSGPAAPAGVRAGGVARLTAQDDVGTLDPALAYTPLSQASFARARLSWQIEYATCAKLVNYPDQPAPVGSQLVPEVARSLPTRSRDGRTYTFTIRRNFRFSPPSGEHVTAATFKYAIERSLSPRMQGPALGPVGGLAGGARVLEDVVGASSYMAGRASHISGVVARGDRLTITLVRPDATLPARLALPFFCAVPTDTPIDPRGLRTVPSAGPYYVATYVPGQRIVLRRNPRYGGDRRTHLQEIDVAIGVPQAEAVAQIESGRADYALDGVPVDQDARLTRTYGPDSPAARAGHRQYFVNPTLALYALVLNTSRPPFSDPSVRRAVNYAIDRRALLRVTASFIPATATDQYIPPGLPGFRDARLYSDTPDLRRARRLMRDRHTTAVFYSCAFCAQVTNVVVRNLAAIGIDVRVKEFAVAELQRRIGTRGEPFDLTITARSADYGDPSTILGPLFDGRTIRASGNDDVSYLDDPDVNRRLDAAAGLSGTARYLAYAALDAHLARNVAPLVPVANTTRHDFFSSRIGCRVYHPIYGTDLATLCITS